MFFLRNISALAAKHVFLVLSLCLFYIFSLYLSFKHTRALTAFAAQYYISLSLVSCILKHKHATFFYIFLNSSFLALFSLTPAPPPPPHPPFHSLVMRLWSLLWDAGKLAVSCILARVKCHKVPFSICLFHATLHQPLTCGVHVVQEGVRFIQSKAGWN